MWFVFMFLTFVASFPAPLLLRKVFCNNLLGMVCCASACKQICVLIFWKILLSETEPRRRQCEHYRILFGQFPRKVCSRERDWSKNVKHLTRQIQKKIRQELIACRLHSGWLKAEERCTVRVSVSPFRWPDCRVFVSAACFTVTQSTESQWNSTLTLGERPFPKLRLDFFTRCSVTLGGPARWGVC